MKLFKFEIQKCGQFLCAHKPCFLMPGHKCDQIWENVHSSLGPLVNISVAMNCDSYNGQPINDLYVLSFNSGIILFNL